MEFETLDPNDDLYILGDFNINLLYKDKWLLKNTSKTLKLKIKKYNKTYGLVG